MGSSNHKTNNHLGVCNTGLGLSLYHHDQDIAKKKPITSLIKYDHLSPSDLTLGPITSEHEDHHHGRVLHRQASSLSSFSNSSASTVVKRERDVISGEEAETTTDHRSSRTRTMIITNCDDDQDQGSPRKKLRLTKQQYALLEDSFRDHSTLSPKQKHELASQLNLRPRQVEVWFQNRRARTKLKQTEAEYEQWKKCCETLTEENKKLQKELQELKSLKLLTAPLYVPFATSPPPASVTVCPSCDRISSSVAAPQPIRLT